jgi:UDP-N-acetylmuramoyl-tripeptide--D-alanyl-D-alanine ligase
MLKQILKTFIVWITTLEARLVLWRYKPKIVAITGSVGKTSTKDAIYTVLASSFFVRKSEKSFNSEIGVPLTILGCPNGWYNPFTWTSTILKGLALVALPYRYPEWLVLEIGADRPGDIRAIATWLSPHVVVVTRFAEVPVHVEFFDSPQALKEEKSHLVRALREDGSLVLDSDDRDVMALKSLVRGRVITYGFSSGSTVSASHEQTIYRRGVRGVPEGVIFRVSHEGNSVPVRLYGVLGRGHIKAVLAALAVGSEQRLNIVEMAEVFARHSAPPGRMRIIEGLKKTIIIDDTYNSSPVAAHEALGVMKLLNAAGRRIVALGDMLELGKYSVEEHKKVGKAVAEFADVLVTVGIRARGIAEGALMNGLSEKLVFQFEDSREAGKHLQHLIGPGDVILVKGSQGIRMERTVEEIMAHPEDKKRLLVRQDQEWLARP